MFPFVTAILALATSCTADVVPRPDYEALLSRSDSLAARCDELEFQLSDLRLYSDHLESRLDSCEALEEHSHLTKRQ